MKRTVSFSGGRSSAMMLHLLLERGETPDAVLFYNTGKEREETLDFVQECSERWSVDTTWLEYDYLPDAKGTANNPKQVHKVVCYETAARNGEPFAKLIRARKAVPNSMMRFCTQELKIRTGNRYLRRERGWTDYVELLGIRYDEPRRWQKAMAEECRVYYPLVERRITKADVMDFWNRQPFDLTIDSAWSNCDLCFMKGNPQLVRMIQERPYSWQWWNEQEWFALIGLHL